MTELEKIQYTKMFIDKLANGINPLDGTMIPDSDLLNNVRISRCMFYVSGILRRVIENNGITPKKAAHKLPFAITNEQLQNFPYSDVPIPLSTIVERINAMIDTDAMNKLTFKDIAEWLISIDVLKIDKNEDGKNVKRPTENAEPLGITLEERQGQYKVYHVVVYDRKAQELIIDNMDAILKHKQESITARKTNDHRDEPPVIPDIFPDTEM